MRKLTNSFGQAGAKLSKMLNSTWKRPPEELVLEDNEIHLWLVTIDSSDIYRLKDVTSNDERARAARFHRSQHKTEYLASRIHLRNILGNYTGINPQLLRFEYNKYGKPSIAGETKSNLKFNFSHSNGLALFALTLNNEIGVDLEPINQSQVDKEVAAKTLSINELARFNALTINKRVEFFYKCWTRKEAYLKAVGKGLTVNPNKIETHRPPDIPIFVSNDNKELSKKFNYTFINPPSIMGFAAALAVEGVEKQILGIRQY